VEAEEETIAIAGEQVGDARGLARVRRRLVVEDPPSDARFETPASGLYWQVSKNGRLVRSPSLWDQTLPTLAGTPSDDWRSRVGDGPFQTRLAFLERRVLPEPRGSSVLVQVAQDAAVLKTAGEEFGRELALFLGLLWLVLSAAAQANHRVQLNPLTVF
jgi:hypothetical protein